MYFKIRDQMNHSFIQERICQKCKGCNSGKHDFLNCGSTQYIPNRVCIPYRE
jgi:hypothetical protein